LDNTVVLDTKRYTALQLAILFDLQHDHIFRGIFILETLQIACKCYECK